jgi:hypothetical protein
MAPAYLQPDVVDLRQYKANSIARHPFLFLLSVLVWPVAVVWVTCVLVSAFPKLWIAVAILGALTLMAVLVWH